MRSALICVSVVILRSLWWCWLPDTATVPALLAGVS